jgi:transcriptional regulator GlxA family with amidase domain
MATRRVLFVIYPGLQALDLTGPHQMFSAAAEERPGAYTLSVAAAVAGPVVSQSGLALVADLTLASLNARMLRGVDTLIVVGGTGMGAARADGAIAALLKRAAGRVRRIASVCTGAFFLADAGLLEGRRAATHWAYVPRLRREHPRTDVDGEAIFVRDGAYWTSAGVTAGIDMALAMIEDDLDRDVALAVARRNVVFRMRPGGQAQFSAELEAQAAPGGALAALTQAIAAEPARDWRIEQMAAHAGLSLRSLSRAFARSLKQSPAAFVERVRMDAARRLLVESEQPVETIARACGFSSLRQMDRAFARTLAVSPSAFRARFSSPLPERRP